MEGLAVDLLFTVLADRAQLSLRLLVLRCDLLAIIVKLLIRVDPLRAVRLAIGLVLVEHGAEDVLPLVLLSVTLRVPIVLAFFSLRLRKRLLGSFLLLRLHTFACWGLLRLLRGL